MRYIYARLSGWKPWASTQTPMARPALAMSLISD
jgi:hypothetical protein